MFSRSARTSAPHCARGGGGALYAQPHSKSSGGFYHTYDPCVDAATCIICTTVAPLNGLLANPPHFPMAAPKMFIKIRVIL